MTHRRVYRSSSHFLVRDALLDAGPRLVPAAGIVHDLDYRQHDWNFNQNSDDGGKRSAEFKAKKADCCRDCQLEEVARSNQG